jgi:hypothetical protein
MRAALWESLAQNHPFVDGKQADRLRRHLYFSRHQRRAPYADARATWVFVAALYEVNRFRLEEFVPWLNSHVTRTFRKNSLAANRVLLRDRNGECEDHCRFPVEGVVANCDKTDAKGPRLSPDGRHIGRPDAPIAADDGHAEINPVAAMMRSGRSGIPARDTCHMASITAAVNGASSITYSESANAFLRS